MFGNYVSQLWLIISDAQILNSFEQCCTAFSLPYQRNNHTQNSSSIADDISKWKTDLATFEDLRPALQQVRKLDQFYEYEPVEDLCNLLQK